MAKATTETTPEPAPPVRKPRQPDPDPVVLFNAVSKANDKTIELAIKAQDEFKRTGAHFPEMGRALNALQSASAALSRVFQPSGIVGAIPSMEGDIE